MNDLNLIIFSLNWKEEVQSPNVGQIGLMR